VVTRAGDPNTELLALLREHCPDCADELLQQLALSITEADPDGLRWRSLTLGDIPGVQEFIAIVSPPVQAISTVLSVINGILDAISALLVDITDPFRALIMAAYQILKDIISDFLGSGAYVYTDAPGLVTNQAALVNLGMPEQPLPPWLAGGTRRVPAAPADGFGAWAARFQQSFDDPGDDHRPTFSDGAPVTAVFIVATAPQLPDLARFASLYKMLLDTSKFEKAVEDFRTTPLWPDDPDRSRLQSRSVAPDWRSWRLRDIGPPDYPLRELEKVPEILKNLLLNGDSIVALIKALIAAVQDKIKILQEMVKLVQQVIDLLKALSATGLHVLPVATNEGVGGLVEAFLSAQDRPGTDPETGELTGANAIIGACVLAGGSEIDPVAALTVWALLGQSGSMDQAFAGLHADVDALVAGSQAAVKDAGAALSDAWHGAENGTGPPGDQGIRGLVTEGLRDLDQNRKDLLAALGISEQEADEATRSDRVGLAAAVDGARGAGKPIDPLLLAHVEATRRAQRRGARSPAMSMGPRQGYDGGPATTDTTAGGA
jgi:hypothetical protein